MTKEYFNEVCKLLARMDAFATKVRAAPAQTHTKASRAVAECSEVVAAAMTFPMTLKRSGCP